MPTAGSSRRESRPDPTCWLLLPGCSSSESADTMTVLTAANQLTLLRLLLVPVFVLCMLYDRPGWALVTFAVAGITDALDGLLARRSGPTTLGAWLDPMA